MIKPVYFLFTLLFTISFLSHAQDFIIKKDTTVYCEITHEDSLTIFYTDRTYTEQSISKTHVYKYFKSATGKIKNGFLTQKPNIDSLSFARLTNDTIIVTKNGFIDYRGEILRSRKAFDIMRLRTDVRPELRKAKVLKISAILLGAGSGVLMGDFFVGAISGNFKWAEGGASLLGLIIGITLEQQGKKHFLKAIELYNTKPGLAAIKNFKPELGITSKGFGVCLRF